MRVLAFDFANQTQYGTISEQCQDVCGFLRLVLQYPVSVQEIASVGEASRRKLLSNSRVLLRAYRSIGHSIGGA
eukprot:1838367-Rhodomonas_salina.2